MNEKTPALFLDRDGIINVDKGYVFKWEDIEWFDETIELIKSANQKGIKVIVLTNQSGVEKGMYQESDVVILHQKMHDYLTSKNAHVTDWFYSLELNSPRRKPNPGMLFEATSKHQIDLSQSVMVGDKVSDIFISESSNLGLYTFIVRGAYDLSSIENHQSIKNVTILNNHQEMLRKVSQHLKL